MVNLIAAIIISALVGFLAGHFSSQSNDPAPVSLKEAVTGEIDSPPAQFNLPRPPAQPRITLPKSTPVMCEQGKTLQEQIAQLKFVDIHTICREAERNWQNQNVENYAPMPPRGVEHDRAIREFFEMVKESAATAVYWQAESTVAQGDRSVQIEIFANFADSRQNGGVNLKDTPVTVDDPHDLCVGITPMFVINGRGMPTHSMSNCGGPMRKRGDSYYFLVETHNDDMLAPVMSALLVPVPGANGSLEYLNSQTGQWVSEPAFRWRASSGDQMQEAVERHAKKAEQR